MFRWRGDGSDSGGLYAGSCSGRENQQICEKSDLAPLVAGLGRTVAFLVRNVAGLVRNVAGLVRNVVL
jgi:hypothetical protein